MTKVINLYGGPGTGKSTNASLLFALLKQDGYNAELVSEYVKQWAWEGRNPVNFDQFYFFGKQMRKETHLFGKVDIIVTDAPVVLTAYYAEVFGSPDQAACFRKMVQTYYDMCKEEKVRHTHVFLKRVKPYNPKGRFQTEEEARAIDEDLRKFVKSNNIHVTDITGDREGIEKFYLENLRWSI